MIDDMFKVLGEHAAEILFEIITESMDDYLYIFDLQDIQWRFHSRLQIGL